MEALKKTTGMAGYQTKDNDIPKLPSTLSDHPSLVGIIRLPFCSVISETTNISLPYYDQTNKRWQMVTQSVDMATKIQNITMEDGSFTISKNDITDFYPYTYYVLTDGETEPLILKPQYMKSTSSIKGKFALSNQPIERYYVEGYKGDYTGNIYNITNLNQMFLPCATNEGTNYLNANANTIMQNRKNSVANTVLSTVGSIADIGISTLTANQFGVANGFSSLANTINGINHIKSIDSRNNDLMLVPNSISSFGTPSTRNAFDNNKVRLLKYTINDNYKNKVLNYVRRYGYKYNNYNTINHKNYRGYIKIISPVIDSKIDNTHIYKIKQIFERGVYIE